MNTVLLIAMLLFLASDRSCPRPKDKDDAQAVLQQSAAAVLTAETLCKEYDDNVVAADQKYSGEVIEVCGKITSIGIHNASPVMTLRGHAFWGEWVVSCVFIKSSTSKIAALKKNELVKVKDLVSKHRGYGIVSLKQCLLVEALGFTQRCIERL
ncbi:OB-fold putative lipoprotein [bacterium]|nr:OB-fold putative lipoprotein [bacterium]